MDVNITCKCVYICLVGLGLLPDLLVLHLERNAISTLQPSGLLSSTTPTLRELYLTNNTVSAIAEGALDSAHVHKLHLDSNQLTQVPTDALTNATNLEELNLSHNSIRWVGANAFQPFSQSLKRLYMDQMSIKKVRKKAAAAIYPQCLVHSLRFYNISRSDILFLDPDVQGCSGGFGSRAEGSDCERKPAGGTSRPKTPPWPGSGGPA